MDLTTDRFATAFSPTSSKQLPHDPPHTSGDDGVADVNDIIAYAEVVKSPVKGRGEQLLERRKGLSRGEGVRGVRGGILCARARCSCWEHAFDVVGLGFAYVVLVVMCVREETEMNKVLYTTIIAHAPETGERDVRFLLLLSRPCSHYHIFYFVRARILYAHISSGALAMIYA